MSAEEDAPAENVCTTVVSASVVVAGFVVVDAAPVVVAAAPVVVRG